MNKYDIVLRPIITEKSTKLNESTKYAFEVDGRANKTEVKKAIEEIFNVKVSKVNIVNQLPREKRVGRYSGYDKAITKAYVTLSEGKINLNM